MDKLSNHVDGDLNKATEHTLPELRVSRVCVCVYCVWLFFHRKNAHTSKRPRTPDAKLANANGEYIVYIIFINLTHVMMGE